MIRHPWLPCLFVTLVLLAGCARRPPIPYEAFQGRPHNLYPGSNDGHYQEYRLGPGDQFKIHVQRHEEFEAEVKVEPSGEFIMPLSLERVQAQGLTVSEVEQKISVLVKNYLTHDPVVRVELIKGASRFVYVWGAVGRPGKIDMQNERLYVREAVIRAGSPLREAATNRSTLVSSTADAYDSRKIRLKDILIKGDLRENYELNPGDIIFIPYSYASEIAFQIHHILSPFQAILSIDNTVEVYGDVAKGTNANGATTAN